MSHVPIEDLFDKIDSKYRLVIIAAKRSRQLNRGAAPLIQPKGYKPTYIALEEIPAGRIEYQVKPVAEEAKAGVFAEVVKPTWFRELAPEALAPEEEVEEEEVRELEGEEAPEVEEELAEVVEGEIVDIEELEQDKEEKEEA
jgi:DNA-directed RNA polymerase subunit omega